MSDSSTRTQEVKDRAQYGMCAGLALLGGTLLFDASRIGHTTTTNDRVGPRAVPIVLGIALLVVAVVYALDVARGGHGEAEEGEDVDLSAPTEWRVVLPLLGAFLANILLIDVLGWVISGAMLFWGSAWALGSRHPVRDAGISVALALVTFYGFYVGLGILLPAGVLEGVL
jgi:putative tricarboxylic transport membrane protein